MDGSHQQYSTADYYVHGPVEEILGESSRMHQVRRLARRVAATSASVLITGETGVGKDLVARTIHAWSERAHGPFIAINCGAIPETLIEAELFGHDKGSFTGAIRSRQGVFERARGGTLFLDEISEMPPNMQTRLLRVLQTRRLYRVGGDTEITTDVRIVAATNCRLREAVAQGQLRQDLVYRLAVFPIQVPALRQRGDDVLLLACHFLKELNARSGTDKRFREDAAQFLRSYDWPGNVRELRNCIERAFIQAEDDLVLDESLLLPCNTETDAAGETVALPVGTTLDEAERRLILATLHEFSGNKRKAAATLGCSIKTLYNKLQQYRGAGAGAAASSPLS